MHFSRYIRQPRLFLLLALGAWFTLSSSAVLIPQPPGGPAPVVVGHVVKSTRAGSTNFVGTIQAIRSSQVGSPVAGRVVAVLVETGDPVRGPSSESVAAAAPSGGQVMVELETNAILIQRDIAEAQMKQAEMALRELESRAPLDRKLLESKVAEAEASVKFSEAEVTRMENLQGSISITELESARLQRELNRQLLRSAVATLAQFDATIEIQKARAEASLAAANSEWKRWTDTLEKHTIRAPFEGYVTQKLTEVGRWLSVGDAVAEVVQLDPIEFRILVPQAHIQQLQETIQSDERDVEVTVEGLEGSIPGRIHRIVPQADIQVRSFPVLIRMDNPGEDGFHKLKPGMVGNVRLSVGKPTEMLLVKKDALVLGGERPAVLVVQASGDQMSVRRVAVETGDTFGDWIQIIGNISENDRVVVKGNERLRPGQPITITGTETDQPPEG